MPLIATRGAASAQGFGEFAQTTAPVYIEDVFSTWLYTGNGSTQTITNGIDLAGNGGLTWFKSRNFAGDNYLIDSARGITKVLISNSTAAQATNSNYVTGYNNNGFGIEVNLSDASTTYASWTFRKAEKFFDVVTYTGDGAGSRNISHSLGSIPGFVAIKCTSASGSWRCAARENGGNYYNGSDDATPFGFNSTNRGYTSNLVGSGALTSTTFDPVAVGFAGANTNGATYVAYLFAHNAGGFGDAGSDNVITCGSYTGSGGTTTPNQINLGYEAQWVLVKPSSGAGNWAIADMMRGSWIASDGSANFNELLPNTSGAENANNYGPAPTATGFAVSGVGFPNASGVTYIYIAIRRGPMKTPTVGTSVFTPVAYTGNGSTRSYSVGFPTDLSINMTRSFAGDGPTWNDRLRGTGNDLYSNSTQAEASNGSAGVQFDNNTNIIVPNYRIINGDTYIDWCMRRAPGFFDVACYTGDAAATNNQNHNLGVTPEMLIFKSRNNADNWAVFFPVQDTFTRLNSTSGKLNGSSLPSAVTSTTFNVGNTTGYSSVASVNISGYTYVTYLFASVAGVSKVGSYTGTGTTLQVNCGFTGGSRFVLIKRTDSTGDWYVWDSARGIVAGNDPYLLLNSSAAEVTNTDYVDTYSAGFEISSTAPAAINANGGTYIFLAIA